MRAYSRQDSYVIVTEILRDMIAENDEDIRRIRERCEPIECLPDEEEEERLDLVEYPELPL